MSTTSLEVDQKIAAEKSIKEKLQQVRDKASESMRLGSQAADALKQVVSLGTQSLATGAEALKELQAIIATLDPESDLAKKLDGIYDEARASNMWGKTAVALLTPVGANAENSLILGTGELEALNKVIDALPGYLNKPVVFSKTAIVARDGKETTAISPLATSPSAADDTVKSTSTATCAFT